MSQSEAVTDTSSETPDRDDGRSGADTAPRNLSDAAKRALAEAEERRAQRDAEAKASAKEVGGASGPDPARYGDWEKDGICSDF